MLRTQAPTALALLVTILVSALPSIAAVLSRQVPETADIFYLSTCGSNSSILYFANNTSPHPSTAPTASYELPLTQWNETYSQGTILNNTITIRIDGDGYTKNVGDEVGRGMYEDIPTCKGTGYSIYNCYKDAGEVVWKKHHKSCVGDFYCTRANEAVC